MKRDFALVRLITNGKDDPQYWPADMIWTHVLEVEDATRALHANVLGGF